MIVTFYDKEPAREAAARQPKTIYFVEAAHRRNGLRGINGLPNTFAIATRQNWNRKECDAFHDSEYERHAAHLKRDMDSLEMFVLRGERPPKRGPTTNLSIHPYTELALPRGGIGCTGSGLPEFGPRLWRYLTQRLYDIVRQLDPTAADAMKQLPGYAAALAAASAPAASAPSASTGEKRAADNIDDTDA